MIIPVYHVVASMVPIAATTTIEAGMVVSLDSSGYAVKAGTGNYYPLGLAGDRNRASEAYEWVNRVSDSGNDTRASGMLTVYHSGGEFYVDVDDSALQTPGGTSIAGVIASGSTTTPGTLLYTENGTQSGKLTSTPTTGANGLTAKAISAAASLDGGIPGEYEPLTGTLVSDDTPRTWVKIKLLI